MKPDIEKILVINYFFPPIGSEATVRNCKLTKYLVRLGWLPTVIGGLDSTWPQDHSLLADIPECVRVHRVPLPATLWRQWRNWMFSSHFGPFGLGRIADQVGRLIDFPGTPREWSDTIAVLAQELACEEKFAAICISVPPYSAAMAVNRIQSVLDLPVVVDFHDPWSQNEIIFGDLPSWLRRRHARAERSVVSNLDAVACAHPQITDFFRREYNLPDVRCRTVYAGFDEDDYRGSPSYQPGREKTFVISHIGSFYNTYTPAALAKALREYWQGPPEGVEQVELRFIGGTGDVTFECQPGLKIRITERVTHALALEAQKTADLLLITFDRRIYGGCIPSKLFEYLGSGRPILGVLPTDGTTAEILRECRAGWIVDCDQPRDIIKTLYHAIREIRRPAFHLEPNQEEISRFSYRKQADVLSGLLTEALK